MTTGSETNGEAKAMDVDDSSSTKTSPDSGYYSKYIMKNQFAKGSYGTVWVASPKDDPETEYAVKVIDRSLLKEKDKESVQREVAVLKELQDLPHVIPLVEFLLVVVVSLIVLFIMWLCSPRGDARAA